MHPQFLIEENWVISSKFGTILTNASHWVICVDHKSSMFGSGAYAMQLLLPSSSVLALHELTEKADCVLPVENQVSILHHFG